MFRLMDGSTMMAAWLTALTLTSSVRADVVSGPVGLTEQEYQTTLRSLADQGYKLKLVVGYPSGSEPRYAACWTKNPPPVVGPAPADAPSPIGLGE